MKCKENSALVYDATLNTTVCNASITINKCIDFRRESKLYSLANY